MMKKQLILIAFMVTGVVALAQERSRKYRDDDMTARRDERRTHSHRVEGNRHAGIKQELSLTDRQYDRFRQENRSYREKLSRMKHHSLHEQSRKAEFMKLKKAHEREMKSILNKKQYQQWSDRKRADHHRGDRHHRHHSRPHSR